MTEVASENAKTTLTAASRAHRNLNCTKRFTSQKFFILGNLFTETDCHNERVKLHDQLKMSLQVNRHYFT